jgi:hypothetical protein
MNFQVRRIQSLEDAKPYQESLFRLLETHRHILLDDAQRSDNPQQDSRFLVENTLSAIPYLWLLIDEANRVWAAGALTDIQPNRHAFLHGISDSVLPEKAWITKTFWRLAKVAFEELKLLKIKAEFEADNRGAKGFCLRLGFQKEALFQHDILVNGELRDVFIYTFPAEKLRT